ncbi:MAG: hypothetical protein CMC96_03185 [Flavobacteriales bacterium]|nr:hypothetical protein [Flavobacteriales bacterium]|tara:strand:+ start:5022 stop:5243 length:222 start_codon:yes stop_codon:yes gene_type:complete
MEINITYNHIMKLIKQLPKSELLKLQKNLQTKVASKEASQSLRDLLLEAPNWSNEDLEKYKDSREFFNNSRIA